MSDYIKVLEERNAELETYIHKLIYEKDLYKERLFELLETYNRHLYVGVTVNSVQYKDIEYYNELDNRECFLRYANKKSCFFRYDFMSAEKFYYDGAKFIYLIETILKDKHVDIFEVILSHHNVDRKIYAISRKAGDMFTIEQGINKKTVLTCHAYDILRFIARHMDKSFSTLGANDTWVDYIEEKIKDSHISFSLSYPLLSYPMK